MAAALYAAACDFQKAINPGPCAAVTTCADNTPIIQGTNAFCNPAHTTPATILRNCGSSGSSSNNCVGVNIECYKTATCKVYEFSVNPPVLKCKFQAAVGDPTMAINNTSPVCTD